MSDIGNSHVIDYYLHRAMQGFNLGLREAKRDFDIETEQREGWSI